MAACSSWEFRLLFDLMTLRLKAYYTREGLDIKRFSSDYKIIGYPTNLKNNTGGPPDLPEHISQDPRVKDWVKTLPTKVDTHGQLIKPRLTSNHLRQLLDEVEKAKQNPSHKIMLKDTDEGFIANYLGYNNLTDLRKELLQTVTYKGYYYSNTSHVIKEFELAVFAVKPQFAGEKTLPSRMRIGYFYEEAPEIPLEGEFHPFEECWLANLKDSNRFLNLTIFTRIVVHDIQTLLQFPVLYGSVTGLSHRRELLNLEIVLVKKDEEKKYELAVQRYLNIRRNHFEVRILDKHMKSLADLRTNHLVISTIDQYARWNYRVLTLGPRDKIIQCRFSIKDDYEAFLEVPHNEIKKPLRCRLFFDNLNNNAHSLLLWTYLEDHTIYSFVSISFTPQIEHGDIINGYFCIANQRHRPNMVANRYVMAIDGGIDGKPQGSGFSPCRMTKDQARQEAAGDPILDKLLRALLEK